MSRQVAVYRRLTALYPRSFRDEYRDDLTAMFASQLADDGALRCWLRTALDLMVTVPTQQMESQMNRTSNHLVPLIYTAIAAGGALVAIVGGSNRTMLVIGACIALAAGAAAVVAWRRSQPIVGAIGTNGWWKFIVAGAALVAGVVVAAGLGVEEWFLGMLAVFVGFVLTLTGVVLGIARLMGRQSPSIPT